MIYLTTGANGAGKTLNTLKHVREKQLAENRAVYYNGFALRPEKAAEFGWQTFDPRQWQALPDGSILIIDECQNEFPVRGSSAPLPEYVRALSEHRRRGFDLYMITQHPQNIDLFVRRLIGSPGWHRHLKRTFGADLVSQLEWSAVNAACEKPGSGKDAKVSMVPYPKEVYAWYDSAVIHTGKKVIPRQLYVVGIALLLVPLIFWYVITLLMSPKKLAPPSGVAPLSQVAPSLPGKSAAAYPVSQGAASLTAAGYVDSFTPRVPGLPHTAPRYAEVTQPVSAPYPAACLLSSTRCKCYTDQGTAYATTVEICTSVAKGGYYVDWRPANVASAAPRAALPFTPPSPVSASSASSASSGVSVPGRQLASLR